MHTTVVPVSANYLLGHDTYNVPCCLFVFNFSFLIIKNNDNIDN